MSFWKDVRELSQLIRLKVAAGHGTQALNEAMKEQVRKSAVSSVDAGLDAGTMKDLKKKGLGSLAEALKDVPPGQQLRMSAAEYRKWVNGG